MQEIRKIVAEVIAEAKKKKKDEKEPKYVARPAEYGYADSLDFSDPLGAENRYKAQGQSNVGPYANAGNPLDQKLRAAIREAIAFEMTGDTSPWHFLSESMKLNEKKPPVNVWESLATLEEKSGK